MADSKKSKVVAALLAFFFGGWGIDQFYLGNKKHGIISIVLMVLVVGWFANPIWSLVRTIQYLVANEEKFNATYVK